MMLDTHIQPTPIFMVTTNSCSNNFYHSDGSTNRGSTVKERRWESRERSCVNARCSDSFKAHGSGSTNNNSLIIRPCSTCESCACCKSHNYKNCESYNFSCRYRRNSESYTGCKSQHYKNCESYNFSCRYCRNSESCTGCKSQHHKNCESYNLSKNCGSYKLSSHSESCESNNFSKNCESNTFTSNCESYESYNFSKHCESYNLSCNCESYDSYILSSNSKRCKSYNLSKNYESFNLCTRCESHTTLRNNSERYNLCSNSDTYNSSCTYCSNSDKRSIHIEYYHNSESCSCHNFNYHSSSNCRNSEDCNCSKSQYYKNCDSYNLSCRYCTNSESRNGSRSQDYKNCESYNLSCRYCTNSESGNCSRSQDCKNCESYNLSCRYCTNSISRNCSRSQDCKNCESYNFSCKYCTNSESRNCSRGQDYKNCESYNFSCKYCTNSESGNCSRSQDFKNCESYNLSCRYCRNRNKSYTRSRHCNHREPDNFCSRYCNKIESSSCNRFICCCSRNSESYNCCSASGHPNHNDDCSNDGRCDTNCGSCRGNKNESPRSLACAASGSSNKTSRNISISAPVSLLLGTVTQVLCFYTCLTEGSPTPNSNFENRFNQINTTTEASTYTHENMITETGTAVPSLMDPDAGHTSILPPHPHRIMILVLLCLFLVITLSITIAIIVFCKKTNSVFMLQKCEQDSDLELDDLGSDLDTSESDCGGREPSSMLEKNRLVSSKKGSRADNGKQKMEFEGIMDWKLVSKDEINGFGANTGEICGRQTLENGVRKCESLSVNPINGLIPGTSNKESNIDISRWEPLSSKDMYGLVTGSLEKESNNDIRNWEPVSKEKLNGLVLSRFKTNCGNDSLSSEDWNSVFLQSCEQLAPSLNQRVHSFSGEYQVQASIEIHSCPVPELQNCDRVPEKREIIHIKQKKSLLPGLSKCKALINYQIDLKQEGVKNNKQMVSTRHSRREPINMELCSMMVPEKVKQTTPEQWEPIHMDSNNELVPKTVKFENFKLKQNEHHTPLDFDCSSYRPQNNEFNSEIVYESPHSSQTRSDNNGKSSFPDSKQMDFYSLKVEPESIEEQSMLVPRCFTSDFSTQLEPALCENAASFVPSNDQCLCDRTDVAQRTYCDNEFTNVDYSLEQSTEQEIVTKLRSRSNLSNKNDSKIHEKTEHVLQYTDKSDKNEYEEKLFRPYKGSIDNKPSESEKKVVTKKQKHVSFAETKSSRKFKILNFSRPLFGSKAKIKKNSKS